MAGGESHAACRFGMPLGFCSTSCGPPARVSRFTGGVRSRARLGRTQPGREILRLLSCIIARFFPSLCARPGSFSAFPPCSVGVVRSMCWAVLRGTIDLMILRVAVKRSRFLLVPRHYFLDILLVHMRMAVTRALAAADAGCLCRCEKHISSLFTCCTSEKGNVAFSLRPAFSIRCTPAFRERIACPGSACNVMQPCKSNNSCGTSTASATRLQSNYTINVTRVMAQ
jgi:hypothetical protein